MRGKIDIALFFALPENEMMKVKNIIYKLYDYILYSITLYMNKHGVVNKNPHISSAITYKLSLIRIIYACFYIENDHKLYLL